MEETVRDLVSFYGTRNPFELAEKMDIIITYADMKRYRGLFLKPLDMPVIVISQNLPDYLAKFVLAHEIGHSVLHSDLNALAFKDTLFSNNRHELDANRFAIYLLISDEDVKSFPDRTIDEWACILGLPREIIELRF